MLEWVCPRCDRAVDPAFDVCPFCKDTEPTTVTSGAGAIPAETAASSPRGSAWAVADRVSRFVMGFVTLAALAYFLVFLWAYYSGNDDLLAWLARLLFWRRP